MTLRVCTFNAAGRAGSDFPNKRVRPDLVLLQEARAAYWPGAFMPVQLVADRKALGATAIFSPTARIKPLNVRTQSLIGSSAVGEASAMAVRARAGGSVSLSRDRRLV